MTHMHIKTVLLSQVNGQKAEFFVLLFTALSNTNRWNQQVYNQPHHYFFSAVVIQPKYYANCILLLMFKGS